MILRTVSWSLRALGLGLLGVSLVLPFMRPDLGWWLLPGMIALVSLGGFVSIGGRRMLQPSAEELLARDERAPVVYLRSFGAEQRRSRIARFVPGLLGRKLPGSVSAWAPIEQDEFSAHMRCIGPYVAIGRPGERLPALGAARLYVGDDRWKSVVRELVGQASVVLFELGRTEGLAWEVGHLVEEVSPLRVLWVLPGHPREYRRFLDFIRPQLPEPLPEKLPDSRLMAFRSGWRPYPLARRDLLLETLMPWIRENGIPFPEDIAQAFDAVVRAGSPVQLARSVRQLHRLEKRYR